MYTFTMYVTPNYHVLKSDCFFLEAFRSISSGCFAKTLNKCESSPFIYRQVYLKITLPKTRGKVFNPLNANSTKWLNTLEQFSNEMFECV